MLLKLAATAAVSSRSVHPPEAPCPRRCSSHPQPGSPASARPSMARSTPLAASARCCEGGLGQDSGARGLSPCGQPARLFLWRPSWLARPTTLCLDWGWYPARSGRLSCGVWGGGAWMGAWGPVYRRLAGCLLDLEPPRCSGVHGHRPPSAAPAVGPGISGWRVLGPTQLPGSHVAPTLHLHSGQPSWRRLGSSAPAEHHPSLSCGHPARESRCSWGPCMRSGVREPSPSLPSDRAQTWSCGKRPGLGGRWTPRTSRWPVREPR